MFFHMSAIIIEAIVSIIVAVITIIFTFPILIPYEFLMAPVIALSVAIFRWFESEDNVAQPVDNVNPNAFFQPANNNDEEEVAEQLALNKADCSDSSPQCQ